MALDFEAIIKSSFRMSCIICTCAVQESLSLRFLLDHLVICEILKQGNPDLQNELIKWKDSLEDRKLAVTGKKETKDVKKGKEEPCEVNLRNRKVRAAGVSRLYNYFQDFRDSVRGDNRTKYPMKAEVEKIIIEPLVQELKNMFGTKTKEKQIVSQVFDMQYPQYTLITPSGELVCQGGDGLGCEVADTLHVISPCLFDHDFKLLEFFELDHVVEQSKIWSFVVEEARRIFDSEGDLKFNPAYIFQLLFHRSNLRLVHRECHQKTDHKTFVDEDKAIVVNIFNTSSRLGLDILFEPST